jgi:hypothetical protein
MPRLARPGRGTRGERRRTMRLRDLSIRRKLMLIIMLTTVPAVVLASLAYLIYDSRTFRDKIVNDLETLAGTLQANTVGYLLFNDRETVRSILAGLENQPRIVAAQVVDLRGTEEVFAEYRRADAGSVAAAPGAGEGHVLDGDRLHVTRRMRFGDRVVGSIRIVSDLQELQERRRNIFEILALVVLGVSLVASLMAALVQGWVSHPILELVQVVRTVSERKDYSARAAKGGNDELGRLMDGINEMLAQIELRDEELQVARDKAEQASRSKSAFLANMSHELRTPLTAIIGYSEILSDDAKDLGVTDFLPDLEKIRAAGRHLLGLINSILDLSKVEAGKMDLLPEKFEIEALVEEVVSTARPLMEKNRNRLEVKKGEHLGWALNDVTKIRQILLNLLSNAAKFTEGGEVVLEARRERGKSTDWLVVEVRDTGIGMTPDQLRRLFQPFSQAEASTARNYGGTGLGLALSKRFAELIYGKVKAAGVYGKGSTFTLKVPTDVVAAKQHEHSVERLLASGEWAEEFKKPRSRDAAAPLVLVIDDEPAIRELLEELLAVEGFRVAHAGDGDEGLKLARELSPAIVTLDVKMPGRDGWTVLTELKSDPELAAIPVIMISVVDEEQKGYALGADYLTKPIDRDRLAGLLAKYRGHNATPLALVVDDDPNVRGVLSRLLAEQSWEVEEAEDGVAALRRVAESAPTLILLDLMMPRMDGFDFVAQLRKNASWRHIPVVVLTAMDLGPEDLRRLNGGVERVLAKGAFSLDELKSEIRSLARGLMAA